ncbi:hypothetical protein ACIRLA_46580 [Streptomyces sp. NPDC102364]|uniref:hypothetical protein n=1 Tax=Streptomyces sp. NPDC102364 TaxID=3366161 RepID=UPI0037F6A72F
MSPSDAAVPYRTGDPDQDLMFHVLAGLVDGLHTIIYTDDATLRAEPLTGYADITAAGQGLYAELGIPTDEPMADEPYGDLPDARVAVARVIGHRAAAVDVCGRTYRLDRSAGAGDVTDGWGRTVKFSSTQTSSPAGRAPHSAP